MCKHLTASIAVDTNDMAVLEPSGYILTAVAAKALEITSAGFRCALEPSRPSCCLAPLARAALPRPVAGKLRRALFCVHRTRSCERDPHALDGATQSSSKACGGQRFDAQGGNICGCHLACTLAGLVRGWDRRGGMCEHVHSTSVHFVTPAEILLSDGASGTNNVQPTVT